MKTRKLAAKALSVAVVATTVSGYAMAGDHSISVDVSSTPYCSKSYATDNTSSWGGNGSCGGSDVQVNFSGKIGNGWTYAFNLDPSDWDAVSTAGNGKPLAYNAGKDMWASVLIEKDLGNGLTLGLGDTGDGDRLKNYAGHWEGATHADPDTKGGMKLSYAKGNLDASVVLGSGRAKADDDAGLFDDMSFGAGMKFGKFDVGASYHMFKMSDNAAKYGLGGGYTQNDDGTGVPVDGNAIAFGAGGSFGNYNIGLDYLTKTVNACAAIPEEAVCDGSGAAAKVEKKTNSMGAHVWASGGEFRPGFSYTTDSLETTTTMNNAKVDANSGTVVTTKMAAGVAWHPKAGGPSVRLMYQNSKTDAADDNAETTLSLKVAGSVTVL